MTDTATRAEAQDIATVEHQPPAPADSTAAILSVIERAAANPDVDIDKMERLLAMQERVLDRQAEREYNEAMRLVQQECEPIVRKSLNKHTKSKYAALEEIAKNALPIITKHGFSLSFETDDCPRDDHYRFVVEVMHDGGMTKRKRADIPIDDAGPEGKKNKSRTHAFGSTMSYGQRYMTVLAFNLAFTDDDGNAAGAGDTITEEQVHELRRLMEMTKTEPGKFLEFMKADRLEDLPISQYGKADALLNAKLAKQQKERAND